MVIAKPTLSEILAWFARAFTWFAAIRYTLYVIHSSSVIHEASHKRSHTCGWSTWQELHPFFKNKKTQHLRKERLLWNEQYEVAGGSANFYAGQQSSGPSPVVLVLSGRASPESQLWIYLDPLIFKRSFPGYGHCRDIDPSCPRWGSVSGSVLNSWCLQPIDVLKRLVCVNHYALGFIALLAQKLGYYQLKSCFLGDQFSTSKICSPKICLTWPTTLGGLMPYIYIYIYMEVTSLQGKWVCSLQLLTTWEKECQRTHIWCICVFVGIPSPTSHSSLHERVRSAEWTFAPYDCFNFHEAGKSAECRQGVECRRRLAWWWQVWSRG